MPGFRLPIFAKLPHYQQRKALITFRMLVVMAVATILVVTANLVASGISPLGPFIGGLIAFACIGLMYLGQFQIPRLLLAILPTIIIFTEGSLLNPPGVGYGTFRLMLLGMAILPAVLYDPREWRYLIMLGILCFGLVFVFPFSNEAFRHGAGDPNVVATAFGWISVGSAVSIGAGGLFYLILTNFRAETMIEKLLEDVKDSNEELRAQNDLIAEKNEELLTQNDLIANQNRDITDSIHYARRIQTAILPQFSGLSAFPVEHTLLYKPRDIVSGDFYWMHVTENGFTLAVVDCTGHGVPGAFMSVLGYALLNQLAGEGLANSPAKLLERLDSLVYASLNRIDSDAKYEALDGMDASVLHINFNQSQAVYAGANRPMWLLNNGTLEEIKGTRRAVGGARDSRSDFEQTELPLRSGQRLFLFSDGITDQLGGPQGRKYSPRRLRELLESESTTPLLNSVERLKSELAEWQGATDQMDDQMFLGLEIR